MIKIEIRLILLYLTTLLGILLWGIFEISNVALPLLIVVSIFAAFILPLDDKIAIRIALFALFLADLVLMTYKAGSTGMGFGALNLLLVIVALRSHKNLQASAIR